MYFVNLYIYLKWGMVYFYMMLDGYDNVGGVDVICKFMESNV